MGGLSNKWDRVFVLLGGAFALLALIYIAPKALYNGDGLDFKLIWLAGKLWMSGVSPYSEAFRDEYLKIFGEGPNTHFWVYPPYWFVLSAPLSWMPFRAAVLVWNLFGVFLLCFTAWLTAQWIAKKSEQQLAVFLIVFSFGALLQATPFALALGQTSFLVAAGAAIFIKGYAQRKNIWLAAGLVLLMMKPHVGLCALVMLAFQPGAWRAVIAAGVTCIAFSLPAFALAGASETVLGFLNALGAYRDAEFAASQPQNLTGFVHLWSLVSIHSPPTTLLSLVAGAIGAASLYFVKDRYQQCLILFGAVLAFVPMHTYDFSLAIVLLPLVVRSPSPAAALAVLACLLLFRCGNVASVLGWMHPESSVDFKGTLLASIAAFLMLIAALANGLAPYVAGARVKRGGPALS